METISTILEALVQLCIRILMMIVEFILAVFTLIVDLIRGLVGLVS